MLTDKNPGTKMLHECYEHPYGDTDQATIWR